MKALTRRQQQILSTIREHLRANGMPPTRAELATLLGLRAASTIEQHLQALAQKGFLEILPGLNRNIRLLSEAMPLADSLPLVGRVAAGQPILAEQHIEVRYCLAAELFRPRPDYLLRVSGMSMRDAGILDGDLLAVRRAPEARNGDVVVARLDDEVTVKRFERHGQRVRLLPANPDFQPIELDLTRQPLVIEGVAVGVIRSGRI